MKNEKSAKKQALNRVKNPLCETGLVVKAPRAKRKDGLIVTLLMEKAVINLVAALPGRRGQNTQHAALLLEHAKRKVEVSLGVKKPREVKNNED